MSDPVDKSVAKSVTTQPGRNGGTLKVGGDHARPGRPPDAWKARMAELADKGAKAAEAKKILDDPEHPCWMGAWKFVTEQAYGKPDQKHQMSGDPEHPMEVVVRVRKEA